MNFKLRYVSFIWKSVFLIVFTFIFQGCVPQDNALSPDSLSSVVGEDGVAYAGFTGLTSVETLSANKIKLNWSASTDSQVIAYNVYETSLMFEPRLVKTIKAPANTVTLQGLTSQMLYIYRVRAVNSKQ